LAYPNEQVENYAQNSLTGSGSQNASEVLNKLNTNIYNANDGNLSNKILLNSVSGQNTSSYNTGQGGVETGDAVANLSLLSAVNTNVTGTGGMKTFNIYDTHQGDLVFTMDDFKDGAQFTSGNPDGSYQNASNNLAENAATGPDSENSSQVDNEENETVDNKNQATLKNDITINAVSGENNTVKNTGEGDIETGDATAVAALVNFLNTNLVVEEWMIGVVNIFGELLGDIVLPKDQDSPQQPQPQAGPPLAEATSNEVAANQATGPDSENSSSVDKESNYVFENINDAEVLNNIETTAVTGTNTASYNTGPGKVEDGNATVGVQETNIANNNAVGDGETFWLVLVNKMGEWVGNIVGAEGETIAGNLVISESEIPQFTDGNQENLEQAANVATGPDSQNLSSVSDEQNLTVKNENEAKIENDIKIVAQSGKNSGSYNTLGGDVNAGDADVGLSLVNFVNNNLVGKKLIVLVVDVLGKWVGDIVPPDQEQQSSGQGGGPTDSSDLPVQEDSDNSQEPSVLATDGFSAGPDNEAYQQPAMTNENSLLAGNYTQSGFASGYTGSGFSYAPISALRAVRQERSNINFIRGLFVSPAFAQETADSRETEDIEVTTDWLYVLLPSLFGVVITRKKARAFLASLV